MLYWIYEFWLSAFNAENAQGVEGWAHTFSFLNLLKYITFRAALACLFCFGLSLMIGNKVIRRLISLKVGQPIRTADEVHKLAELHGAKAGTPTMGGVMIIGTVLLGTLLCARVLNPFVAVTACTMAALGLLGFCDDYKKVIQKSSDGISPKGKLFWQFTISLVAALFVFFKPELSGVTIDGVYTGYTMMGESVGVSDLTTPLTKSPLLGLGYLAIPLFVIIIIGSSNAVNLTDGLDGLATGCTITVTLAYAIIAYMAGNSIAAEHLSIAFHPMLAELTVFLAALIGAAFGFLWFNCYPAKVFMGDTGSLAIGGAIGTAAICTKQELLLIVIGGIFVMEALSVILQVGSFKLRGGKRIFRMAPIHHHFELGGWRETQVITRFWIFSLILALIGLAVLKVV